MTYITSACSLFAVSETLKCAQLDEDRGLSGYEPDVVCLTCSSSLTDLVKRIFSPNTENLREFR